MTGTYDRAVPRSAPPIAADQAWTALPTLLIRSTGFPFEQLDVLRMPESARCATELLAHEARIDALQAEFSAEVLPSLLDQEQRRDALAQVFRAWYTLNSYVRKRQACPPELQSQLTERIVASGAWLATWNAALAEAAVARVTFEQIYATEFRASRERLHALVRSARFQEALLLSNPAMYTIALPSYLRHYQPAQRQKKVGYQERQLYAYLQRFCTKNDTASFFGPIDYAQIDPEVDEPLVLRRDPAGGPTRRLTRIAYWAAQALADQIAAARDVEPYLRPRLQDGCALLPPNVLLVAAHNQRLRLSDDLVAVLKLCSGQRTLAAVRAEAGPAADRALTQLRERGLLHTRIEIPTAAFDPLAWLRAWVAQLPPDCADRATWLAELDQFGLTAQQFAVAPADAKLCLLQTLEARFTTLTGQEARRGQGTIYADRLLLYDEAQGDISACTIGGPLDTQLRMELALTLDLCASYSLTLQAACRRRGAEVWQRLGGGAQPYLTFVRALDEQVSLGECSADPEVETFQAQLVALARRNLRDGQITLSAAELQPLLRPIPDGSLVSPDLFLAANDLAAIQRGEAQLVVGEIHYGAQVWCHFLTFDQHRDTLAAALDQLFPPTVAGRLRAVPVHRRTQGKTFYLELPGLSIEVLGRSLKPTAATLPVADLEVVLADDGLALRSRSLDARLELYAGDPRSVSNWLFGPPPVIAPSLSLDEHTPRIMIEGVTVWRERWRIPGDALGTLKRDGTGDDLLHACALRLRYGLPSRCFVRTPEERKPFYVDFTSALSLEFFAAMTKDSPTIELSELLPTPDQWWLRDAQGVRSSEWRMTFAYRSADA